MIWKYGDIWIYHKLGNCIVIPTNAGWKANGENVMGAGLAQQAAEKFPNLPSFYGNFCKLEQSRLCWWEKRLILVPTKPLIKDKPWMSWNQSAKEETIIESLIFLQDIIGKPPMTISDKIYVPLLGAGNGGMSKFKVVHLMDAYLKSERFVGVIFKG